MRREGKISLEVKASTTTRQRLPLAFFEHVVRGALAEFKIKRANISIVLIGEKKMRALNESHRNKNGATNVLAYLYGGDEEDVVGDVLVCVPVAKREAKNTGESLKDYIAGLLIHGTLHLMGMTHETDKHADKMEALERVVARKLNIAS